MNKFEWSGLDEEMAAKQEHYIMNEFWAKGKVAALPIKNTDMMVYCPWALNTIDCYGTPETVTLINMYNAPFIPLNPQIVNKNVTLGYCQPNHKSIADVVMFYIDRLVQVDMVINTNLQLQKMPFLIGVDPMDKAQMEDIVDRIINNETVVFASLDELQKIQTLATATPYILDKLVDHRRTIEQELYTVLGIDNNGTTNLEKTHIVADAVNANNDLINNLGSAIENEIRKWLDDTNRIFNRHIEIKCRCHDENGVRSIHEDLNTGTTKGQEEQENE